MKDQFAWFRESIRELFEIDERAISVFRFALGLTILFSAIGKLLVIKDFGADTSLYPRHFTLEQVNSFHFSLHLISGSHFFSYLALLAEAGVGLLLCLGVSPKVVSAIGWLITLSWINRYPGLAYGADHVLKYFLFFSIFLPSTSLSGRRKFFSLATFCILMQLLLLYFTAALLKNGPEWRLTWNALYFALSSDDFTTALGLRLLEYPELLRALTAFSFYLELVGPVCLILPFVHRYFRASIPFLFIGFHLGTILLMDLEIFPWACISVWMLYLPSSFWDVISQRISSFPGKEVVLSSINQGRIFIQRIRRSAATGLFASTFLLFNFALVVYGNLETFGVGFSAVSNFLAIPATILETRQEWRMFSPNGDAPDAWWIFDGVLKDGRRINLETGEPFVEIAKPPREYFESKNMRWKRFMAYAWYAYPAGVLRKDDELRRIRVRSRHLNILCKRYNLQAASEGSKVSKIHVYMIQELNRHPVLPVKLDKQKVMEKDCEL